MTVPSPSPQDDPWSLPAPRIDALADASWLARLIALEQTEHDEHCADGEDDR